MANASAGLIARDADWSDSTAKTKNIFGSSTRNSALQLGGMVFQLDLGVGPGAVGLGLWSICGLFCGIYHNLGTGSRLLYIYPAIIIRLGRMFRTGLYR